MASATSKFRSAPITRWTTRAKFVLAGAALGVAGALALAFDGTTFGPNDPQLVQIEIPLSTITRCLGWNHTAPQ